MYETNLRRIVAFNFDGVIHRYSNGWCGANVIDYAPVYAELINKLRCSGYEVFVYTVRAKSDDGKEAVKKWLKEHNITVDDITCEKPPSSICYVDDQAI